MPIVHTSTLPDGSQFSSKRALRAINFIERATVHTKSVWKKKPFILLLTMSVASRAATGDIFMGSVWVWMLVLSLCAVIGGGPFSCVM